VVSPAGTDQQPSYQMQGDSKTVDGNTETRKGSRNINGKKGTAAPTQAMKAYQVSGGIAILILNPGTIRG